MNPDPSPTKPPMRRRSALETFSQWFWSAWTISNSKAHGSLVDSFDIVDNGCILAPTMDNGDDEPCGQSQVHSHCRIDIDKSLPCKACRTRGVTCDERRPRCSHCLEEQVLCFYVAPLRKGKGKRRSKSAPLEFEPAQIPNDELEVMRGVHNQ